MKLKAVKKYDKPSYPNQQEFTPTEAKQFPFLSKTAMSTVISLLFLSGIQNNDAVDQKTKIEYSDSLKEDPLKKDETNQSRYIQVPVFEHGEGRGSTGCMVMSSPIFVSESDARDIIVETFAKQGITFEESNKTFEGLNNRNFKYETNTKRHGKKIIEKEVYPDSTYNIKVDLFSREHNLGVIFVDRTDYQKLVQYRSNMGTIQSYDLKGLAYLISQEVENYNEFNCAVFYDPMINDQHPYVKEKTAKIRKKMSKYREDKKMTPKKKIAYMKKYEKIYEKQLEIEKNIELDSLKAQVDDFLEWYQKEKTGAKK